MLKLLSALIESRGGGDRITEWRCLDIICFGLRVKFGRMEETIDGYEEPYLVATFVVIILPIV